METTTLKVTGMTCQMCVQHVTQALQQVEGVQKVQVDLDAGLATVQHDGSVATEPLLAAVEEEGYNATTAGTA